MTKVLHASKKYHKPKFRYWRLSQLFLALLLTLILLHSIFSIDNQTDNLAKIEIINGINAQLALISIPAQLIMQETNNKRNSHRKIAESQLLSLSEELMI